MGSESEVQSISNILSGFTSAESAAEEVIDLILSEGGKQLYQRYIDKKSFPFSSEAISNLLIAELKMCFVRHDEGEPPRETVETELGKEVAMPSQTSLPSIRDIERQTSQGKDSEPRTTFSPPPMIATASEAASASKADAGKAVADVPVARSEETPGADAIAGDAGGEGLTTDAADIEAGNAGEVSCCSWELEAEPERCRIDTWARACVPVRRTLSRPKSRAGAETDRGKQRGTPRGNTRQQTSKKLSAISTNTTSRTEKNSLASPAGSLLIDSDKGRAANNGMIPLVEEVEHDEEESAMREMKDREAKRKREEENRQQKKVSEEAEEASRLAQVKDQMKNKPYSYDSSGNIIWVQPLNAEKLPSANTIPSYVLRREVATESFSDRKGSVQRMAPVQASPREFNKNRYRGKAKDPEFTDTFKKFYSQQPPMMETMKMAPGVILKERGGSKRGEDPSQNHSSTAMTRKDYEHLVQSGATGYPGKDGEVKKVEGAAAKESSIQAPAKDGPAPTEAGVADSPADPKKPEPPRLSPKTKAVSPLGMAPHAPAMPRSVPPPTARRVQLKRDAIGYGLSSRERVPTGTGSRYPGCAAPPLLGATMGHGLLPLGSKHEEYYFPNDKSNAVDLQLGLDLDRIADEDDAMATSPRPSAGVPTPRSQRQGQIISKNPDLVKRLFNR